MLLAACESQLGNIWVFSRSSNISINICGPVTCSCHIPTRKSGPQLRVCKCISIQPSPSHHHHERVPVPQNTLSLTGALVSWPTTRNSPRRRARETRRRSRRQPWTWLPCLIIPLGIFNLILCSVVVVVVVVVAVRVAFPSCDTSWVPIFLNICICICMGLPNVTLMIALTVDTVQHMHSPFLFPRTFN